ncbi:MAG TPA: nuclear transport factor 2 family protein [Actinomycetota bacterium]|nr:nuclear transport factor 2 family protein [Actinomycetota bacterium]
MAEHQNVERARKGYEAFKTGDLDTMKELFSDDIVWHVGGNNSLTGDYKGQEDVFNLFGRIMQETDSTLNNEVHDILGNDEHVIALVHVTAKRGSKTLDTNSVQVFHVNSNGNVTESWTFVEEADTWNDFWS